MIGSRTTCESPATVGRSVVRWRLLGNLAVSLCCLVVLLGAAYFGLASCGGYVWHKRVFAYACCALCLAAVVLPSSLLSSIRSKIGFVLCLPLSFVLLESAVAPFYPVPPASLAEYASSFVRAVWYGPCA